MARKKKRPPETDMFSGMEQLEALASQGWPAPTFSQRMSRLMDPDANSGVSERTMLVVLSGILAAGANRLQVPQDRQAVLGSLSQIGFVLQQIDEFQPRFEVYQPDSQRSPLALELAEQAARQLEASASAPEFLAMALPPIKLSLSQQQLRQVIAQGDLSHDLLAQLIPDTAGEEIDLPIAAAAEVCYFMSVAAYDSTGETARELLTVAQRIADQFIPVEKSSTAPASASRAKPTPRAQPAKAAALSAAIAQDTVYRLKITLKSLTPPIWRRIEVEDCSLDELDAILMRAMGWNGGHLSCICANRVNYSSPNMLSGELLDGTEDGQETLLSEIVSDGCKKFSYTYDFGDSWEHEIKIEKTLPRDAKAKYPRCVAGARACPPDDCGGVWGYEELLESLANPQHPRHEELTDWLEGPFDAEAFSPQDVNLRLRRGDE